MKLSKLLLFHQLPFPLQVWIPATVFTFQCRKNSKTQWILLTLGFKWGKKETKLCYYLRSLSIFSKRCPLLANFFFFFFGRLQIVFVVDTKGPFDNTSLLRVQIECGLALERRGAFFYFGLKLNLFRKAYILLLEFLWVFKGGKWLIATNGDFH